MRKKDTKKKFMATVTKENIGLLHEKLTVKLEKTDYLPSFEKALKESAIDCELFINANIYQDDLPEEQFECVE